MEQVSLTQESYGELFRTLSHKRRNGVLSLDFRQRNLQLLFKEGRIVGVLEPGADEVKEIASRLVSSGCIMEKVQTLVNEAGITPNQLYDLLVGKEYVSEEDFRRAKDSYRVDLLHSVEQLDEGFAEFKPKLVKLDDRHEFSVFPAQLLLDVEELKTDRGRLQSLFTNLSSVDVLVREIGEAAARLNDREQRILDAAEHGCRIQEILESCLMSEHEAIESLLALYDQDLIEFQDVEESEQNAAEPEVQASDENSLRSADENQAKLDALAANIERSSTETEEEEEQGARNSEGEQTSDTEESESSSESDEFAAAPSLQANVGLRERIRAGSYHLLNPSARAYALLICTSFYLITLALVGPVLFEHWFTALREFTSK